MYSSCNLLLNLEMFKNGQAKSRNPHTTFSLFLLFNYSCMAVTFFDLGCFFFSVTESQESKCDQKIFSYRRNLRQLW